ncbi:MAG: hypothetical protein ACQKBV_08785 [Puniceicoccales bacterium]
MKTLFTACTLFSAASSPLIGALSIDFPEPKPSIWLSLLNPDHLEVSLVAQPYYPNTDPIDHEVRLNFGILNQSDVGTQYVLIGDVNWSEFVTIYEHGFDGYGLFIFFQNLVDSPGGSVSINLLPSDDIDFTEEIVGMSFTLDSLQWDFGIEPIKNYGPARNYVTGIAATVDFVTVPEPSSIWIASASCLALPVICLYRRKRRNEAKKHAL